MNKTINAQRHENYDVLNLIGYGLSKFNFDFVHAFGFETKAQFYNYIVRLGIAETVGTVKNRQDLFDGMTIGGPRKGWWQKGPVYKHRKDYIDSLFGTLDAVQYAEVVKLSISDLLHKEHKSVEALDIKATPILRSQFKQMQKTGQEAEYYFLNNYQMIDKFADAKIDDARLFGDGYDFQLTVPPKYFLAEVKGVRTEKGQIRMTKNEFDKAQEYKDNYALVVVCNLIEIPRMSVIYDPVHILTFEQQTLSAEQIFYRTATQTWV